MKPTFIPKRSTDQYSKGATSRNGSAVEDTHPWLFTRRGCPEGSIPIPRTPYNNATTSDSHKHYIRRLREHGGTRDKKYVDPSTTHEYAIVVFSDPDKLYGASADFNVYNPRVEVPEEFSLGQIWIVSEDDSTSVEAAWIVYPNLYGDYKTRLATLWTNNNYETFCYNVDCPGFVWTNPRLSLNTPLEPVSVYGGQQYDVRIEIFQDRSNGDWWLTLGGETLGYWPKSIVPKLGDGARSHQFGGEIINKKVTGRHTSTQMGSGHFATEGQGKSAYIKNVGVVQATDHSTYSVPNRFTSRITHPRCYNLQLGRDRDLQWGFYFYFGGPGRSATCA